MTGKKSLNKITIYNLKLTIIVLSLFLFEALLVLSCFAQENAAVAPEKKEVAIKAFVVSKDTVKDNAVANPEEEKPIEVNADTLEYSTDAKEMIATGNVEVDFKGMKLTCQKLRLNTQTKEGLAEGNARLDDKKGTIEGDRLTYNFQTKKGIIMDSRFRLNPYFGKADKVDRKSDSEFLIYRGLMTTCNLDHPHWHILSKKVKMFPGDKVQMKDNIVYLGTVPVARIPQYNHSLKDPLMHVQLSPGNKKDWGMFMLSAWRINLAENLSGRIYFDTRQKLGVAEGFGTNYVSKYFGKGDFKFYYTHEKDTNQPKGKPNLFERYLIRHRHKWDIDDRTTFVSEYYKIVDSKRAVLGSRYNLLKDYFPREYEKDTQPTSYVTVHRSFDYSTLDFVLQKRTNRWYSPGYLEKLPEVKYTMPSLQFGDSRFYLSSTTAAGNYNLKNTSTSTPATNALRPDVHTNRIDTTNQLVMPLKVLFIEFSPSVGSRQTFYDADRPGDQMIFRTIFFSGADLSTKFYRVFNINTNFLRLNLHNLRHVITPTVSYGYYHKPTVASSRLKQIDGVDSQALSHSAAIGLSNKLQTKRDSKSVDLVDFEVTTNYQIKPKVGDKLGSNLGDFLFRLELLPYSWLRVSSDATYKRTGNRSYSGYNRFTKANYDITIDFGNDRAVGIGQRYLLKGGNEITFNLNWRLNPKWKISYYQRRNRGHDPTLKRGIRESEYGITRDLHCWEATLSLNERRGWGNTLWVVFRLKAFPELEFDINQEYNRPRPGSQSKY